MSGTKHSGGLFSACGQKYMYIWFPLSWLFLISLFLPVPIPLLKFLLRLIEL